MRQDFDLFGQQLLELLFPTLCVGCKQYGQLLCPECFRQIEFIEPSCPKSELDVLVACDYNQNLVAKIVTSFKYDLVKNLDLVCAEIIFKYLYQFNCLPAEDFILTFVPMHAHKQVIRGFNQSELIAYRLGAMLNMPVFPLLRKTRKTKAQMSLSRDQRMRNLIGAFEALDCSNKKILLIDDVVTTGSTFLECSKVLKAAGAAEIKCLAFAKD